jgi:hypothetical protein
MESTVGGRKHVQIFCILNSTVFLRAMHGAVSSTERWVIEAALQLHDAKCKGIMFRGRCHSRPSSHLDIWRIQQFVGTFDHAKDTGESHNAQQGSQFRHSSKVPDQRLKRLVASEVN